MGMARHIIRLCLTDFRFVKSLDLLKRGEKVKRERLKGKNKKPNVPFPFLAH
jgi:hypothetical protein